MIYSENILLCLIIPLCLMLPFLNGGTKRFCAALITGMGVCLISAYINSYFLFLTGFSIRDGARYISPIAEETMRLVAVMLYMLLFRPEDNELLHFAAAVGVGFATFENICYITTNSEVLVSMVLIRGLAVGVMHLVCGLLLGAGFIIVRRYRDVGIAGTAGIFSITVVMHSIYNLLVSVEGTAMYIGFCIPAFTIGVMHFLWHRYRDNDE